MGEQGTCVCDASQDESYVLNAQTGWCECAQADHFMHPDHGCLPCTYQVPGCFSCSSVLWDTGIPLDSARLNGPGNAQAFLTCDKCEVDERFVRIELNPTIPAPAGFDYAAPTYANLPAAVGVS